MVCMLQNLPSCGAYEANLVTTFLKSKKTDEVTSYDLTTKHPSALRLLPQLESNENKEEVIIKSEFDAQNSNLGFEVGKQYFNTKALVAREQRLEELDRKMEELQKTAEFNLLESAKRMDAWWNELREPFNKYRKLIEQQSSITQHWKDTCAQIFFLKKTYQFSFDNSVRGY